MTEKKETSSIIISNQREIIKSNEKEKDIYFIILNQKEEKGKTNYLKFLSKVSPIIIYEKEIEKEKGIYIEHKVFKLNIEKNDNNKKKEEKTKKENNYKIEYEIENDIYSISFDVKENSFIYDIELKKGNKYLDNIVKENINQNIISLYNKLEIFLEALKKNNEEDKIEKLYEETIDLYKKKKQFNLLISLFIDIYEYKNLCSKLINIFKEINDKENMDREKNLDRYLETFNKIYLNADNIIKSNEYDPVNFYGIILCYLNYYDTNKNFSININKLYKENANILYEILVIFYSQFIKPLNQDLDFYNNFIRYVIENKELNEFEKILNYIKDTKTFIYVIYNNKDEIFNKFNDIKPIKLSFELKLIKKNKEIDNIIDLIEQINDYSKNKKKLLLYFTSTFWINLLKQYNKPDLENIKKCHKLRNIFKEYNNLINNLFKDDTNDDKNNKDNKVKNKVDDIIKSDINKYYERDEFAFILNKNIREYVENNKEKLKNAVILGITVKFNPYFNIKDEDDEKKYKFNRDTFIFDYINFNKENDEQFIQTFHNLEFELIFKGNITDFLNKIHLK